MRRPTLRISGVLKMLAELAAANAAFSIIKKCVQNGAEIATAGKAISDFTNAKDTIDNKARKDSSKNKQANSDLESFLARDQIKAKEDELRSMMNLFGRPNMYNDYIRFCAEARKQRIEARKKAIREREQFIDTCLIVFYWAVCISLALAGLSLLIMILAGASR